MGKVSSQGSSLCRGPDTWRQQHWLGALPREITRPAPFTHHDKGLACVLWVAGDQGPLKGGCG